MNDWVKPPPPEAGEAVKLLRRELASAEFRMQLLVRALEEIRDIPGVRQASLRIEIAKRALERHHANAPASDTIE